MKGYRKKIQLVLQRAALPAIFLWLATLATGTRASEGGTWVAFWTAAQQGAFIGPGIFNSVVDMEATRGWPGR